MATSHLLVDPPRPPLLTRMCPLSYPPSLCHQEGRPNFKGPFGGVTREEESMRRNKTPRGSFGGQSRLRRKVNQHHPASQTKVARTAAWPQSREGGTRHLGSLRTKVECLSPEAASPARRNPETILYWFVYALTCEEKPSCHRQPADLLAQNQFGEYMTLHTIIYIYIIRNIICTYYYYQYTYIYTNKAN